MISKMMDEILIETFAEYIKVIEKEFSKDYVLFRGHREDSKKPHDLLPKIARGNPLDNEILSVEKNLFNDFKKLSIPFLGENSPQDDWEWLTLAQHHGLPTRLLDWSQNPLAALWFVVNKPPRHYKSYGIVWVFKPEEDDFVDFTNDKTPFDIKKTKVYEPNHIAKRITAQAACFTVHKYMGQKAKFLPLNKNKAYSRKLKKIVIEGDNFESLRSQLDRCGINAVTLFADLDSLCKHLAWKSWNQSYDRFLLQNKDKNA